MKIKETDIKCLSNNFLAKKAAGKFFKDLCNRPWKNSLLVENQRNDFTADYKPCIHKKNRRCKINACAIRWSPRPKSKFKYGFSSEQDMNKIKIQVSLMHSSCNEIINLKRMKLSVLIFSADIGCNCLWYHTGSSSTRDQR